MRRRVGFTPLIILLPALALAGLIAFQVARQVRHTLQHLPQVLQAQLTSALGRQVRIGSIRGNWRTGFEVRDLVVARSSRPADGALLRVGRLRVRYALSALLRRKAPPLESLRSIEIEDPWLFVSRDAHGRLNLQQLAQELAPPGRPRRGPPARFVGLLVVRRGSILFEDHAAPGRAPRIHHLRHIELRVDARADPLVFLSLQADSDAGRLSRLRVRGSVDVRRKSALVAAQLRGVHPAAWLPYLPRSRRLPVQVVKGVVDLDGGALVVRGKLAHYRAQVVVREGALRVPRLAQPIHALNLTLNVAPDVLQVEGLRLRAGKWTLAGNARLLDFKKPWVRAHLSTTGLTEADVRALLPTLPSVPNLRLGQLDNVSLDVEGPLQRPEAWVRFDLSEVAHSEGALSQVHLEARAQVVSRRHVRLEVGCLTAKVAGASLFATATAEWEGRSPRYWARASVRDLPLEALPLKRRLGEMALEGMASADLQVAGVGDKPEIHARLLLTGGRYQEWHVSALQCEVAYRGSTIEVRRALVRAPEAQFFAVGTVDLNGPVHLQVAATDVDVTALAPRLGQPQVRGVLFLSGEVTGTYREPQFKAEVAAYDVAYGEERLEMVRGQLSGNLNQIQVQEMRGFLLPAQFGDVAATLTDPRAGPDAELEATGTAIGIDVGLLARRFMPNSDYGGIVDVEEVKVSGPLNALKVEALVTARSLRAAGRTVDYASGRIVATHDGAVTILEDEPLVVRIGSSEANIWGTLSADRQLNLHVVTPEGKALHIEDLQTFDPAVLTLASSLSADVHIVGTASQPEIRRGLVSVEKLVVNGHAFGSGNGEIVYQNKAVRVNRFVLNGEPTSSRADRRELYELDGEVWPTQSLTAVVQAAPIERLLEIARVRSLPVPVQGRLTALLRMKAAQGQPPQIHLERLEVEEAVVGPQPIETLSAEGIALERDAVVVRRLHVGLKGGTHLEVTGRAALTEEGPLQVEVSADQLDLALAQQWVPIQTTLGGNGRLMATLGGSRKQPALQGTLQIAQPTVNGYELDEMTAQFSFRENVARVTDLQVKKGDFVATAGVEVPVNWEQKALDPAAPLKGYLAVADQSLAGLLALVEKKGATVPTGPQRPLTTDGIVNARVDLAGTLAQPDLHGTVAVKADTLALRSNGPGEHSAEALRLTGLDAMLNIERDRVNVERFHLASARLPSSRAEARRAKGKGTVIGGLLVTNLQAVDLSGAITLRGFLPDQFDLKLALQGFEFEERNLSGALQESLRLVLDTPKEAGPLVVSGRWPSPEVKGRVVVRQAKVDLRNYAALPPSEARAPLPFNPRFDIRVTTAGEAEVLAPRTHLYAALQTWVRGSLNAPQVNGTVTATAGSINLPTAHFRLKEAEVQFLVRPPAPFTATGKATIATTVRGIAEGTSTPKSYAITGDVTIAFPPPERSFGGAVAESRAGKEWPVDVAWTASPYLDEEKVWRLLMREDLLKQVARGGDLGSTVKQEVMNYMAVALQPHLFEPVERALVERLGLTEFSISASMDQPVEVKMGKYLVKNLRISYSRTMSAREARYKLTLDYEVVKRVSLSWSTNERGGQVFGLESGLQF